jgi:Ca2+-binding RTX toxin-like protein
LTIKGSKTGNDNITGGSGNDTISTGSAGTHAFTGGGGADLFTITTAEAGTISDLGNGSDNFTLSSAAIGGTTATVTANYTAGATTFNNALLADAIVNGSGFDVNMSSVSLGSAGFTITGNNTAATLRGSALDDSITGGTGADSLVGNAGADVIVADTGVDTINGGTGNDTITGAAGADVITTGTGSDDLVMLVADVGDTIADFAVTSDDVDWNTALLSIDGNVTTPGASDSFQSAAAGTAFAVTTTVFELTGVTTGGSAANLVTALGSTATNGAIVDGDKMLIVNYLTAGGAQMWSFEAVTDDDVVAGDLTLAATFTGVAADSFTAGDFI